MRCYLFIILLQFNSIVAIGQIKNLVFEGAGIRGVAYVGAIRELHDTNQLGHLEKIGGTSAGAIAALTLSLGYSASEIEKIIYDTKIQKFNDGRFLFIGGISRLNRNYGWYRGQAFTKWLEGIIKAKTGNSDITFQQLHDAGFKDLYVTGTSLNHQKLIVFSVDNYPNMKIKDAVRISVSIPLYFQAVLIDSVGNVKSRKQRKPEYDIMVDGGFTGNFPITIFDSVTIDNQRIHNPHTIGLRIDTPEQIKHDEVDRDIASVEINSLKNYVGAFYNYVIENLNRQSLTKPDWHRTISISSGSIGPKIRKLSVQEKNELIANGKAAVQRFASHSSHK